MTDITLSTLNYQAEKRSWLIVQPGGSGVGETEGGMLDISALTAATHYPNGYVPSGLLLGIITATGLYAPYNDSLTDGTQTAAGILFSSVKVPNTADTTKDVGIAVLTAFATVKISKLPIANNATGRGYYDAAAKVDLKNINFIA
jgi:hypothetical protein